MRRSIQRPPDRRVQAYFSLRRSMKPERRRSDGHSRLWLPDFNDGEVTVELNRRRSFGDGEVGVIRAHDTLEHLRDPIHTMCEIYRCLAPLGWLLWQTPGTDDCSAF